MSKRGMYWRVFAGLALAVASATAQTDLPLEVPAIINTYRADPSSAGSLTIGSYTLTPRAVRELYYESFVAGYMQGEPTGTTLYGLPAGPADYGLAGSLVPADSYPILGRTLRPDERMPRMPLVRSPGPDGLYGPQPGPDGLSNTSDDVYDDQLLLHVRIEKLPTTAECQEVVNHMMRTGLLPGDPDDGTIDAGVDAQATGRWRLIIHPPRTKGAPPAPSLYFPEAIQAVTPATAAADLPTVLDDAVPDNGRNPYALFWGGLRVRWRQWDEWVRGAWDSADAVAEAADPLFGQEAVPFFLPYPRFLPVDSATKIDHTNPAHRASFQAVTNDPHNQFFDAAAMWENRQLNPHYSPDSGDLTNDPEVVRLPHEVGHLEFEADRPERALSEISHARPLEYLLGAAETGWWLQGVHTSGPAESSQAGDPEYLDPAGRPGNTVPIDLTINLMDGRYWANGAWHGVARPQPVAPGVGMVELQFEYETGVAGRSDTDLEDDWADLDWGSDDAYDPTPDTAANEAPAAQLDEWYEEAKDAVCADPLNPTDAELDEILAEWDPRGADGTGGTADDNPLRRNLLSYEIETVSDARGADQTFDAADEDLLLRDPVNELRTEDRDATAVWRIRRFSGWPFNPLVAGHTTAAGHRYQGGPVTCRFVVSAIQALPEDQQAESADAPALGQMATYDTANGRRYPQPDALPANYGVAGGPVLSDLLERATYLLGYRADIPAATPLAGPGEDYFFPIRPGSSSEAHRFFVQSVMEQTPGGLHLMWTDPANVDPANHATDPAAEEYAEDGYPLRGPGDVTEAWEEADADETVETPPQFVAYRLGDGSGTPPAGYTNNLPNAGPDRMLHAYAVGLWLNSAEVTTERDDRGVQAGDLGRWDVRRAFDGDPRVATPAAGTPPLVSVPENYTVGTLFESETYIDRIEVYWHHTDAVAEAAGDWVLELATQLESTGDVDWTTAGGMVQSALPNLTAYGDNVYSWVVPSSNLRYVAVRVRSEYAAAELVLDELRVVTRADLRKTVSRSIESPLASQDTAIVTTPLADAGVQVSEVLDREITPRGDNTTDAELR
ncbi:MAG: hypothetical protein HUU35_07000, partial [Armatimonadetes bacterium]|nr:hypothetical protein [Armatimonadota bacterium]